MSSSESPEISIGLVGLGVVGSGLVQLLETHSKTLEKRSGLRFKIKKICSRTFANKARLKLSRYQKTKKWQDIVADPEIKIVVELIGGTDTAYELIQAALKNGKHVVTANKAVLAKHGPKLFDLAIKHRVELFYEAAIGGGIPIVKIFKESLIGNRIEEFYAIINGTTNFILSQMVLKEAGFGEALRKAQELGFAEADPSFDINGSDAMQKTSLLAMMAFGAEVNANQVYREGIEGISLLDISAASGFGYKIKLLGIAKRHGEDEAEIRVHPTLIPRDSELASTENEYNAVFVKSDFLGTSLYYGKGAGSFPTASSVMSDVHDLGQRIVGEYRFHPARYQHKARLRIKPMSAVETSYYFRVQTTDMPGILARITSVLAKNKISVKSLVQKDYEALDSVSIIFITHMTKEKNLIAALKAIEKFPFVKEKPVFYRIEDLG